MNTMALSRQRRTLVGKANNLIFLKENDIKVPKFFVISDEQLSRLPTKIGKLTYPIIIRSSANVEDTEYSSFAGVFHSAKVEHSDNLTEIFSKLQKRNEKSKREVAHLTNISIENIRVNYIFQEYQESVCGGVMKVPINITEPIVIEYADSAEEVTSGNAVPKMITIDQHIDISSLDVFVKKLLKISEKIRLYYSNDQEAEWLESESGDVYLLQTRPYVRIDKTNLEEIISEERERLKHFPLHVGAYNSEILPDIHAPTPLTLELISYLYRKVLNSQKVVKKNSEPILSFGNYLYYDAATRKKSLPVIREILQSKEIIASSLLYKKATSLLKPEDEPIRNMTAIEIKDYLTRILIRDIFRNSGQLDLVQKLLKKKLKVNILDPAFIPLLSTPIQKSLKEDTREEFIKKFWFVSDNEYELSSLRLCDSPEIFKDIEKVYQRQADDKYVNSIRQGLIDRYIDILDAAYITNLFKLYDFLQYRRAILHDQLIEGLAAIGNDLRILDRKKELHNLIWYASWDEIETDNIPDKNVLLARRNKWTALQNAPLVPINDIESWDQVVLRTTKSNDLVIIGKALVAGITEGTIGKEVFVTASLFPGILSIDTVKAIITQRGGSLSHVALLARERNIPVVRTDGSLERFTAGMRVIVDGNNGTIQIIPS